MTGNRVEHADQPLFDPDLLPVPGDRRSVGELLRDIDAQSRLLLFAITGDDAAPMLRGWPDVVTAAADLWQALPGRPADPERAAETDRPMTRIAGVAAAMAASMRVKPWPGPGPADPRTAAVAGTLAQAGRLVTRYGAEVHPEQAAVRRDIEAARIRLVHALYVTVHAVRVALHEHSRDLRQAAEAAGRPIPLPKWAPPHVVGRTAPWLDRLSVCERAAGQYLKGRYPQELAGEVDHPSDDPARLRRALAAWDLQVHRTVAARAAPPNLVVATDTQAVIAAATARLLIAAEAAGGVLGPDAVDRLVPAAQDAGHAWSRLASRWGDLWLPSDRPDPALLHAAAEVRAAYAEYTHDKTNPATADATATRPGFAAAVEASLEALEAAPELAYVVRECTTDPTLAGPARTLSIRAHNDVEAGIACAANDDVSWVSPSDIAARRVIPLPPPVTEGLTRAAAAVASTAARTANLIESVNSVTPSTPPPEAPTTPRPHSGQADLAEQVGARMCGSQTATVAVAPGQRAKPPWIGAPRDASQHAATRERAMPWRA